MNEELKRIKDEICRRIDERAEETRRHMDIVAKSMRDEIRLARGLWLIEGNRVDKLA